jgi:hypothetical protein
MNGICTLGNDYVYDQVIALLNSIEAIYGQAMPVCIYPYDDRCDRLREMIKLRPQVQIYDHEPSIQAWDQFVREAWDAHPTARRQWNLVDAPTQYYRVGTHRRFGAFDAPFDRFIYMDADTVLIRSVDYLFDALDRYDFVVYDFQYKDPSHVYDINSPRLNALFPPDRIQAEIFCSGFYASKKNVFDLTRRTELLHQLQAGDAEILYAMAPDQTLLNYMVMKSGITAMNFSLTLPSEQKTGCCVTSANFTTQEGLVYDRGNCLTYLHYIGVSSQVFTKVCQGENIDFPYRDVFLHYRYRSDPSQRPALRGKPKPYQRSPHFSQRLFKKLLTYSPARTPGILGSNSDCGHCPSDIA